MVRDRGSVDWPDTRPLPPRPILPRRNPPRSLASQIGFTVVLSFFSGLILLLASQVFAQIWLGVFTDIFLADLANTLSTTPARDEAIAELNALTAAAVMTATWAFFLCIIATYVSYRFVASQ